jgi:hypothetical protein
VIDGKEVHAIHVYPEGPTQHMSSMDCWCEPRFWGTISRTDQGGDPLPVIIHADWICVVAAMRDQKLPEREE